MARATKKTAPATATVTAPVTAPVTPNADPFAGLVVHKADAFASPVSTRQPKPVSPTVLKLAEYLANTGAATVPTDGRDETWLKGFMRELNRPQCRALFAGRRILKTVGKTTEGAAALLLRLSKPATVETA